MTDQVTFRNCGGEIAYDDKPQAVMPRNADRVGAYVANLNGGPLHLFFGEGVEIQPFKAVLLPVGYQGPVTITGKYTDRFQAVEFSRDTLK
jgi:hypothetical protein